MSPENEISAISLLASYCEYCDSDSHPLETPEEEEIYEASLSEIQNKIASHFPELDEDQLEGFYSKLFNLMNGSGLWDDSREISDEHMGLVEKGHQEYLRRKAETIERLNNGKFLGKISCFLLGCEVINLYVDILNKI